MTKKLQTALKDKITDAKSSEGSEYEDVNMEDFVIGTQERNLVQNYLSLFTINNESSLNEHIDINLMLKALPNKSTKYNFS